MLVKLLDDDTPYTLTKNVVKHLQDVGLKNTPVIGKMWVPKNSKVVLGEINLSETHFYFRPSILLEGTHFTPFITGFWGLALEKPTY